MRNNRGYALKLAVFVIAFLLIGYGYYGFFYVPQNSGYGGPKCIIESFSAQQSFSMGGPCMYSIHSLVIGILLFILAIVIVWKFP